MKFGEILKSLRKSRGLTQEEFAKQSKISRSAIGMYESDKREPNFETLEAIADFFNVDMNTLLGKEPQRAPAELPPAPSKERQEEIDEYLKSLAVQTILVPVYDYAGCDPAGFGRND